MTILQERQELIQQWENAVAQMRRTDDAINAASTVFAEKRSALRDKQRKLDISAQFLDDQMQTNRECEGLVAALERDLAALRSQYATEQARISLLLSILQCQTAGTLLLNPACAVVHGIW